MRNWGEEVLERERYKSGKISLESHSFRSQNRPSGLFMCTSWKAPFNFTARNGKPWKGKGDQGHYCRHWGSPEPEGWVCRAEFGSEQHHREGFWSSQIHSELLDWFQSTMPSLPGMDPWKSQTPALQDWGSCTNCNKTPRKVSCIQEQTLLHFSEAFIRLIMIHMHSSASLQLPKGGEIPGRLCTVGFSPKNNLF